MTRDQKVIELINAGYSHREIALMLWISKWTISSIRVNHWLGTKKKWLSMWSWLQYKDWEVSPIDEDLTQLELIVERLKSKGIDIGWINYQWKQKHISNSLPPYRDWDPQNVLIIWDLHCLPLDTSEVLTQDWRAFIKDVEEWDTILSYKDWNLLWSDIEHTIIKWEELVYNSSSRWFSIESTSEHRNVVVIDWYEKILTTSELLHLDNKYKIKRSWIYVNEWDKGITLDMCFIIWMMIWDWTKDVKPSWNYIRKLNIKKDRKISVIDDHNNNLMSRCPQNNWYVVYRARSRFWEIIDEYVNKDKSLNIKNILIDLSAEQIKSIILWYIEADWSKSINRTRISCSSINKNSLEDIQTLCHLVWYSMNISNIIRDNSNSTFPSNNPLYNWTILPYDTFSSRYSESSRITQVWCITVNSWMFLCRQWSSIFITGNCPHTIDWYLEFCRKQQEKWNCWTVIFIWDIIDFWSISYHEKTPEELNPQWEIAQARLVLQDWYKTFPKAYVCLGNHDMLPYRQAKTAWLLREFIQTPHSIFWAPSLYEFIDEIEICWVVYTHWTKWDAFTKCVKEWINLVQWHLHTKAGVQYHNNRQWNLFWMQVATWVDYKKKAFDYARCFASQPVVWCWVVIHEWTLPIFLKM